MYILTGLCAAADVRNARRCKLQTQQFFIVLMHFSPEAQRFLAEIIR